MTSDYVRRIAVAHNTLWKKKDCHIYWSPRRCLKNVIAVPPTIARRKQNAAVSRDRSCESQIGTPPQSAPQWGVGSGRIDGVLAACATGVQNSHVRSVDSFTLSTPDFDWTRSDCRHRAEYKLEELRITCHDSGHDSRGIETPRRPPDRCGKPNSRMALSHLFSAAIACGDGGSTRSPRCRAKAPSRR